MSLLRPVYAFFPSIYCSCVNIPSQNIARKKSNFDHLLHVRISPSHDTTHTLLSSQSHATRRPPAGYRRSPISTIPMVGRPPLTNDSQQPSFLRLSKLLRFSPRMNAVRPGRKDQSRNPLDVCFLFFLSYFTQQSHAVPCYITVTFQLHSWKKHSIDFLSRWQRLFQSHSVLVRQREAKGA
jgi:hypothetical protein